MQLNSKKIQCMMMTHRHCFSLLTNQIIFWQFLKICTVVKNSYIIQNPKCFISILYVWRKLKVLVFREHFFLEDGKNEVLVRNFYDHNLILWSQNWWKWTQCCNVHGYLSINFLQTSGQASLTWASARLWFC